MFLEGKVAVIYTARFPNVEAVHRKMNYENSQEFFCRKYRSLVRKMVQIAPLRFAGI